MLVCDEGLSGNDKTGLAWEGAIELMAEAVLRIILA